MVQEYNGSIDYLLLIVITRFKKYKHNFYFIKIQIQIQNTSKAQLLNMNIYKINLTRSFSYCRILI